MESAGFARLEAINYPPGALGAGAAGPVSIEHLVGFAKELEGALSKRAIVAVFCSQGVCANTLLMLGVYLMFVHGLSAKEAYSQLPKCPVHMQRFPAPWAKKPLLHEHSLTVMDCLGGLQMALRNKWIDYQGFDSCEWRRLLRKYDASFAFHLPHSADGESRRLTFYAIADPVTTVADPSVRPKPPEDGFVDDYANIPRHRQKRRGNKNRDTASYMSEPSMFGDRPPDPPANTSSRASSRRHSDKILEEHLQEALRIASTSNPVKKHSNDDMQLDCSNGSWATVSSGGLFTSEGSGRTQSPANQANPEVTWLEAVRVRRWGQEQHARHSALPVEFIKERGLATLPEFGTWLRSVGCRRLVQLNFPNEPNLPPGGSYTDYFTQWQLQQEHLRFGDGTAPPPQVVQRFRSVVEEVLEEMNCDSPNKLGSDSAIVVHCTGGLGRTGSLLGALAIETLGISGGDWIGWVRMCRPGSVQTLAQEAFLKTYVKQETKQPGCFCLFGRRGSRSR